MKVYYAVGKDSLGKILLIGVIGLLFACADIGNDGSNTTSIQYLYDRNTQTYTLDSDEDGISDTLEAELGTDPNNRDTDRDGLSDFYEVFGRHGLAHPHEVDKTLKASIFRDTSATLADDDNDGLHAALDNDDDNDGLHDGLNDIDGDGIPTKYETYGFIFEVLSGQLVPWYQEEDDGTIIDGPYFDENGIPTDFYITDPTQRDTDHDGYDDYMESTGINMDPNVAPPGNEPVIPAYPDIIVSLVSYEVIPTGTITSSTGGSTGSSWTNSVSSTASSSTNWSSSITSGVGASIKEGPSSSVSYTGTQGGSYGTSNTISSSNSTLASRDWSTAVASDPSSAALLKLNLVFKNVGMSVAYDIQPTLNVMLGSKTIKTYTLPDAYMVDVMAPDDIFPSTGEGTWTVGTDEANSTDKIVISQDELRSIELGAPLYVTVPQIKASIEVPSGTGQWTTESWGIYRTNIESSSIKITVDTGAGHVRSYRVFGWNPNGPDVSIKDVLLWSSIAQKDAQENLTILDRPLENCRFGFDMDPTKTKLDPITNENVVDLQYVINQLSDSNRANGNMMDVKVRRGMNFTIKPAPVSNYPQILWANYDLQNNTASAYAIDYYAIDTVELIADSGEHYSLTDDNSTGIFSAQLPNTYLQGATDYVLATNDRGYTSQAPLANFISPAIVPMHSNDAKNTGLSPYNGPSSGVLKWTYDTNAENGLIYSPVVDTEGNIIFATRKPGIVYALNPDGSLKWTYEVGDTIHSPPVINDTGTIYVFGSTVDEKNSFTGSLHALSAGGSLKWKHNLGTIATGPITLDASGNLYLTTILTNGGTLYQNALKSYAPDGRLLWSYSLPNTSYSAPAIASDGTVYIGTREHDSKVYAIKPDGTLKWTYDTGGNPIYGSITIGPDDTAYALDHSGRILALDKSGNLKWSRSQIYSDIDEISIGPNGYIYATGNSTACNTDTIPRSMPGMFTISSSDGQVIDCFPTNGLFWNAPLIDSAGRIYALAYDYSIYAINPSLTQTVWTYSLDKYTSPPVIDANGILYVGSNDGVLYAFGD